MRILKLFILMLLVLSNPELSASEKLAKGFDFFDHVYSINLEHCVDRKNHVIKEFNRVGIKNYEIFKAVDKNSAEVAYWMKTDFVKHYPPCFRCNKKICNCKNNVLVKPQIGNWLSFIHVFKDIVKNNYDYVLITEDDVKFVENAREIFAELINKDSFAKYNIDVNKPLLIRFEKRGEIKHAANKIGFTKDITMSNACFMVNKHYAAAFLKNLQCIDRTSDLYIQVKILELDRSIQHFTAYPQPAYQLSENALYPRYHPKGADNELSFNSEIHSKDVVASKTKSLDEKRRIEYSEYILAKLKFWKS